MTATVTVRTRAVGAEVTNGNETTTVPPRSSRDFHVDGTGSFSIKEMEPQADEPAPEAEDTSTDAASTEKADGTAFDHDGDGKPGGSLPRSKSKS